jgi:23S rRNA (cytosine1962-C5)-methyltransferase
MMEPSEFFLPTIADGEDKSCPFKNCLRKNYRHLRKWAKRSATNCFRIYDRELHHYPLAIDFYDGRFCVHYFSKHRNDPEPSQELVDSVTTALIALFAIDAEMIFWRSRIRRAKVQQYEKVDVVGDFFTVVEYGVRFKINLVDYLDTGLFLDHRETRRIVASACPGKHVLNLFAYTCSFSVHAALAGAVSTTSVDLSNTYTAWGRDNFDLNRITSRNHTVIRADCLRFLEDEVRGHRRYDVIVIDPPTLSRSKKMEQMFDVQVDYVLLITQALDLLTDDGVIFFSTNSRRFHFDASYFPFSKIVDISAKTLPLDFKDPHIHRCWQIRK